MSISHSKLRLSKLKKSFLFLFLNSISKMDPNVRSVENVHEGMLEGCALEGCALEGCALEGCALLCSGSLSD